MGTRWPLGEGSAQDPAASVQSLGELGVTETNQMQQDRPRSTHLFQGGKG